LGTKCGARFAWLQIVTISFTDNLALNLLIFCVSYVDFDKTCDNANVVVLAAGSMRALLGFFGISSNTLRLGTGLQ